MNQNENSVFSEFKDKNVLFITTKNTDYIRNTQEIAALQRTAKSVTVLGYPHKSYAKRLFLIWFRLFFLSLRRFDAVFVGFAPQLIIPFFGWHFRQKLVAEDFFISLYDTMICDRKKFKDGSFPARILHRLDEKTLQRAQIIIADTAAHADYFTKEFGGCREKIHVVYLEADQSIYYPHKTAKNKKEFLVLYFGSILPLQGTGTILECVRKMREYDIFFDIIGPVDTAEIEKCTGCNVLFTPWLSQSELSDRIAAADLCLAGHFNAGIAKASRTIPGKAYIYEAMEKPMILGENLANRELFSQDDRHFFVDMGDAERLKETILFVAQRLQK